jgi:hypothetical protein
VKESLTRRLDRLEDALHRGERFGTNGNPKPPTDYDAIARDLFQMQVANLRPDFDTTPEAQVREGCRREVEGWQALNRSLGKPEPTPEVVASEVERMTREIMDIGRDEHAAILERWHGIRRREDR